MIVVADSVRTTRASPTKKEGPLGFGDGGFDGAAGFRPIIRGWL